MIKKVLTMNISEKGKILIKSFESLQLKAYKCSANVWTIGYGHTNNVKSSDIITKKQADCFLMQDLYEVERTINRLVKVNIGVLAFNKSTLLAKLNTGDYIGAAEQFRRWNKVNNVVMAGLVRRRQAEEDLFNA